MSYGIFAFTCYLFLVRGLILNNMIFDGLRKLRWKVNMLTSNNFINCIGFKASRASRLSRCLRVAVLSSSNVSRLQQIFLFRINIA